jgi:general secretion pathway protein G
MRSVFSRVTRRTTRRNTQAGLTLLEIMIVIAILGLLVVIVVPRVMGALGSSKVDLTKIQVDKIVKEYYPRWASQNTEKPCPDNLLEIGRSIDKTFTEDEFKDAWGKPLKFLCGDTLPAGASGLAVYSMGEDGKDNTPDDIRSWEKVKK